MNLLSGIYQGLANIWNAGFGESPANLTGASSGPSEPHEVAHPQGEPCNVYVVPQSLEDKLSQLHDELILRAQKEIETKSAELNDVREKSQKILALFIVVTSMSEKLDTFEVKDDERKKLIRQATEAGAHLDMKKITYNKFESSELTTTLQGLLKYLERKSKSLENNIEAIQEHHAQMVQERCQIAVGNLRLWIKEAIMRKGILVQMLADNRYHPEKNYNVEKIEIEIRRLEMLISEKYETTQQLFRDHSKPLKG